MYGRTGRCESGWAPATYCREDATEDVHEWHFERDEVFGSDGLGIIQARMQHPGMLEHIARHDPARVLADVAAKRWIIAALSGDLLCQGHPGPWLPCGDYRDHGSGYCRDYDDDETLRLLASVYADHEDYREEWKP